MVWRGTFFLYDHALACNPGSTPLHLLLNLLDRPDSLPLSLSGSYLGRLLGSSPTDDSHLFLEIWLFR